MAGDARAKLRSDQGSGESFMICILSSTGSRPNASPSVFAVIVDCSALGGVFKVGVWREDGVTDSREMVVFIYVIDVTEKMV